MYTLFIVLIGIIAVLIIGSVLLQSGKGDGLSGMAASGTTTQLLGTRQAPDVLEKATWWMAALFGILCLATTFVKPGADAGSVIQAPKGASTAPAPKPTTTTPTPAPATTPAPAANGSGNAETKPAPATTTPSAPAGSQPAPELKVGGQAVPVTNTPAPAGNAETKAPATTPTPAPATTKPAGQN